MRVAVALLLVLLALGLALVPASTSHISVPPSRVGTVESHVLPH